MEFLKALLAWLWHLTDAALDERDAHRNVRRAGAWIGVAWSSFWMGKLIYDYFTRVDLVEINREIDRRVR